ncbi:MAG: hypothetical protein M1832_003533 [Thelocarpon impressellum]|nr:MAG: hypothetical protein M1832_003533 [Thelocarpon impressellum]
MSKPALRFCVVAVLLVVVLLLTQRHHVRSALEKVRAKARPQRLAGQRVEVGDKVVVMAKTGRENTDWVAEELPDWQQAIYSVDDPGAAMRTPANKGHEAMAYLTYIITRYDELPATLAFIHPHRGGYLSYWHAWHTDASAFSNPASLRTLRIEHVQRAGYANLRCAWDPGCAPAHRANAHVTPALWAELFNTTEAAAPAEVAAACCAQFAVSRDRVRARPRDFYERTRAWLLDTDLTDAKSGRVMEFLWHVIFGMDAVHCPVPAVCYCETYGRC